MKNCICINPADDEMKILANAVKILNQFKASGFTTRKAFVELVMVENPSYSTYDNMEKLRGFWAARVRDQELNGDLEIIIEKLKLS